MIPSAGALPDLRYASRTASRIAIGLSLAFAMALANVAVPVDAGGPPAEDPAPSLRWYEPDGSLRWSSALSGALSTGGTPLISAPWYKPAPDIEIPIINGEPLALGATRGSVVLLDFWATWCEPCREELPQLQALYERTRERGLVAVAVNAGDDPATAAHFAESLGLTMPIGLETPAMTPSLRGPVLPTVVVIDRAGRMRGRWDGYEPGLEAEIARLVERLLLDDGGESGPVQEIARIDVGAGKLVVRWSRRTPGAAQGIAALPHADGQATELIAAFGRSLVTYGDDGAARSHRRGDTRMSSLRAGPGGRIAGFRAGSSDVVVFEPESDEPYATTAAAPILDAAWLPRGDGSAGLLVLATLAGVETRPFGGSSAADIPIGSGAPVSAVIADLEALTVLELEGRLRRFPNDGDEASWPVGADAFKLIAQANGTRGAGVAPASVVAVVAGRFGIDGRANSAVAVATEDEVLRVFEIEGGAILYSARWPGISALAAVDLNGDGLQELAIAAGDQLTVLDAPVDN